MQRDNALDTAGAQLTPIGGGGGGGGGNMLIVRMMVVMMMVGTMTMIMLMMVGDYKAQMCVLNDQQR